MAVEWRDGIPILTDQSLIGEVPEYTQALANTVVIGMIQPYAGADLSVLLPYWLPCDGSVIPGDDRYQVLRDRTTSLWGGNTPDLRGRALIGAGTGSALSARSVGQPLGAENHGLTYDEMPVHKHSLNGIRSDISGLHFHPHHTVVAAGQENYVASGYTNADSVNPAGGNQLHNNMQPSSVVNFIILAATS